MGHKNHPGDAIWAQESALSSVVKYKTHGKKSTGTEAVSEF